MNQAHLRNRKKYKHLINYERKINDFIHFQYLKKKCTNL